MTSIVVIGNGPSALRHRLGPMIDSFDHVVRFNRYRTVGYERQVGTKCTIWVKNDMIHDFESERPVESYERIYLWRPAFKDRLKKKNAMTCDRAVRIPLDCESTVRKLCDMPDKVWPPAGPPALVLLAREFPEIFIYGFDCFDGPCHHYFPDTDNRGVHHPKYDRKFLNAMLETGALKWLDRLQK